MFSLLLSFAWSSVIPSPISGWLSFLSCYFPRGSWVVALFFFLCYCYHLGGRTTGFGGRRARGESGDRAGGMDRVRIGDGRKVMIPGSGQGGGRGVGLVGGRAGEEEEDGGGRAEDEAYLRRRLYRSLQTYAKRNSWSGLGRIHKAVRPSRGCKEGYGGGRVLGGSIAPGSGGLGFKPGLLGFKSDVQPAIPLQRGSTFHLPDLPSAPFFPRDAQKLDVERLERCYQLILSEFDTISHGLTRGCPSGGWRPVPSVTQRPTLHHVAGESRENGNEDGASQPEQCGFGLALFPLVWRGKMIVNNCRRCPISARVVGGLRTFVGGNEFGGAGFIVLEPGQRSGPRHGMSNTRLRCHLGLRVPSNCELVVGGEPQSWSRGRCLLFDDSFLHTICHDGSPDSGLLIIFIVDLWHPNVAPTERQVLDFLFAP
uniref:aspartate beta-hydroxylase domain-containing protein 2-like isoform X2 n=1 Tax=Myxine glutinosa TaxID=7769 RepID=UPI00358E8B97